MLLAPLLCLIHLNRAQYISGEIYIMEWTMAIHDTLHVKNHIQLIEINIPIITKQGFHSDVLLSFFNIKETGKNYELLDKFDLIPALQCLPVLIKVQCSFQCWIHYGSIMEWCSIDKSTTTRVLSLSCLSISLLGWSTATSGLWPFTILYKTRY